MLAESVPSPDERQRALHREMVEAVLTGQGLTRVAELAENAAGAPVAIVIPRLGALALSAGAAPLDPDLLRRHATARVAGATSPKPPGIALEERVITGDETLGCVLLLGESAPPGAADVLHLAAVTCLTEVAIHDARDEAGQTVRSTFLEDLRTRSELDAAEVSRRAARLGCDVSGGAVALCAELTGDRPHHVVAAILGEMPGALAQALPAPAGEPPRVYALLPAQGPAEPADEVVARARRLSMRLRRYGLVGVSGYSSDPAELGRLLQEAELVVEVLRRGEVPAGEGVEGGTYRLLFRMLASHPEELRAFCEDTVAPILRYDEQYGTELAPTLESYLRHNCNMNATAGAIYAHRHTVAYRLERIRDLTGLDPQQSEDRERLGLGLKAYRLLAPSSPRARGSTG